ncbi:MAG: hypothetical protein ACM3X3_05215, partial [Betaproteobacteria bacterium]
MPKVAWQCTCGKTNRTFIDAADLDLAELGDDPEGGIFHDAECSKCGRKHWLLVTFRIEAEVRQVKTDEEYQTMLAEEEKKAEEALRKGYTKPFRVSRDKGKT